MYFGLGVQSQRGLMKRRTLAAFCLSQNARRGRIGTKGGQRIIIALPWASSSTAAVLSILGQIMITDFRSRRGWTGHGSPIAVRQQLPQRLATKGALHCLACRRVANRLLRISGHWFHSTRRSTAELLNARLHGRQHQRRQWLCCDPCSMTHGGRIAARVPGALALRGGQAMLLLGQWYAVPGEPRYSRGRGPKNSGVQPRVRE